MTPEQKDELLELLQRRETLIQSNKLDTFFPDTGPQRRELYPRHLEFFAAGATYRERLFAAGNRTGKSSSAAFELACHLLGRYPAWWEGKRFTKAVNCWAIGNDAKTVRDTIQEKLLGKPGSFGTGMIPKDALLRYPAKSGTPDAVESISVLHANGGTSRVALKTYESGVESFQGAEIDFAWCDEEPGLSEYAEIVMRTMTNDGIVALTMTPLKGLSDVVLQFMPGGRIDNDAIAASRFAVMASWDEAPHLSEQAKKELWDSTPPWQRDSRSKGLPALGQGAIYTISEEEITVKPFPIPDEWPRGFGMDTDQGAGFTAAAWFAKDPTTGTLYLYDNYKRSRAELAIHVAAIKSRGDWIRGVGDAAALIVTQHDAQQLISLYKQAGVDIELPDKSVEAGIEKVWGLLSTGKLKVFSTCQDFLSEYRIYRRDEKGRIVKAHDHVLDAVRYFCMSGIQRMRTKALPQRKGDPHAYLFAGDATWMWP